MVKAFESGQQSCYICRLCFQGWSGLITGHVGIIKGWYCFRQKKGCSNLQAAALWFKNPVSALWQDPEKKICLQFSFLLWAVMVESNNQHCFITPASFEGSFVISGSQPHFCNKSENVHHCNRKWNTHSLHCSRWLQFYFITQTFTL